jgi:hypothetical protein
LKRRGLLMCVMIFCSAAATWSAGSHMLATQSCCRRLHAHRFHAVGTHLRQRLRGRPRRGILHQQGHLHHDFTSGKLHSTESGAFAERLQVALKFPPRFWSAYTVDLLPRYAHRLSSAS